MRMRKKKNLIPRMERCGDRLIREPYSMPGKWRTLMPQARELRVELGCGKGRFTVETAAAEPMVCQARHLNSPPSSPCFS